jgi:hypothetical protein
MVFGENTVMAVKATWWILIRPLYIICYKQAYGPFEKRISSEEWLSISQIRAGIWESNLAT